MQKALFYSDFQNEQPLEDLGPELVLQDPIVEQYNEEYDRAEEVVGKKLKNNEQEYVKIPIKFNETKSEVVETQEKLVKLKDEMKTGLMFEIDLTKKRLSNYQDQETANELRFKLLTTIKDALDSEAKIKEMENSEDIWQEIHLLLIATIIASRMNELDNIEMRKKIAHYRLLQCMTHLEESLAEVGFLDVVRRQKEKEIRDQIKKQEMDKKQEQELKNTQITQQKKPKQQQPQIIAPSAKRPPQLTPRNNSRPPSPQQSQQSQQDSPSQSQQDLDVQNKKPNTRRSTSFISQTQLPVLVSQQSNQSSPSPSSQYNQPFPSSQTASLTSHFISPATSPSVTSSPLFPQTTISPFQYISQFIKNPFQHSPLSQQQIQSYQYDPNIPQLLNPQFTLSTHAIQFISPAHQRAYNKMVSAAKNAKYSAEMRDIGRDGNVKEKDQLSKKGSDNRWKQETNDDEQEEDEEDE
ncbi:MAG: hypothetical protein EZS28_026233, partial [Streblomastix strix]